MASKRPGEGRGYGKDFRPGGKSPKQKAVSSGRGKGTKHPTGGAHGGQTRPPEKPCRAQFTKAVALTLFYALPRYAWDTWKARHAQPA